MPGHLTVALLKTRLGHETSLSFLKTIPAEATRRTGCQPVLLTEGISSLGLPPHTDRRLSERFRDYSSPCGFLCDRNGAIIPKADN